MRDGPAAMEQVDLIVTNGFVVTMNDERLLVRDGAVAIRGDVIVAVGRREDVEAAHRASRTLDARGGVIMPGLVNAHRHMLSTPRGVLREGMTTLENLKSFVYPAFAALSAEDNYWNTLLTSAEMIRNGTTCFQEPGCTHLDSVVQAVDEAGIRCSMGPWAWDQMGPNASQCPDYFYKMDTDECLRYLETSFRAVHGKAHGRIRGAITIEGVGTCSDALTVGVRELAERLGTIAVQHKATSVQEVANELKAFGHRPLEHMYRIGALGPNVLLNHMTALDEFEVAMVAETGTMISHNPSSALKLSKGVTQTGKFPELIQAGVTVALGTDAANASNHSDIFRSMWLAVLLPRDARIDPQVTRAEVGLEMATRNGARAAGWGDAIGALAPGRKADVIVVDTNRPDMWPSLNVIQDLVYSANGSCATHTVVDGRILMEDRRLTTIDEERVLAESKRRAVALLDRIGHPVTYNWPVV
jgi:5-methylthioadenosine/S-adenosylhomocysteine deaminase